MALPEVGVRVVVKGTQRANQQLSGFRRALLGIKKVAAAAPVQKLTRAFGGLLRILPRVGIAIRSVGASLRSAGRSMTTFGSVLSTLGFRLASFISLPIGLALGGMITQAAQFEEKMLGLLTTIGLSRVEVDKLTERLLVMGPALGIDLLELADATYTTLSSTIRDTGQALEIIEQSAKLSAVGLGEAEEIAKLLTAVIVSYGEENITAAEAADTLLAGIQRGALEADEMAEPMSGLIGLTSNLGIEFDELNAFIGTFGASGASAGQAATGMLGVLRALLNPSGEMIDALALMDLTVKDLRDSIGDQGLAKTLVNMIAEMNRLGIDVSDVFGRIQGLNAALFLSGEASDEYILNLKEIQRSQGALDAAFKVTTESTVFQWNQFKASIQAAAITMGGILLPAVNKIIQALLPLVEGLAAVARAHPGLVRVATIFAILAAAIGPVIVITGLLISSIGTIISAVGVLAGVLGALLSPLGLIVGAFAAAAFAIGVLFLGTVKEVAENLGFRFDNLAERADSWGQNIVLSLARGMAKAAVAVVQVLTHIGKIIASWLSPGSPPKLLPDLPEWGANIINELLRGFSTADFGIFNDLSKTISSFFRSLPESQLGKEGIIPAILGGRTAIAEAIAQIRTTGSVTQDVLSRISGAFGAVSQDIQEYTMLMLDMAVAQKAVADAQAEVNRINEEFKIASAPLDDALGKIGERRQEIKDALEEERLQKILDDPRAPALAKELALMDLQELALMKAKRALEADRDVKLDAAQAALDAAQAEADRIQEELDLKKLLIDAQIENNNLMKEQVSILDSLKNAVKDLAGALGALPGAGGAGALTDFDPKSFESKKPQPIDFESLFEKTGSENISKFAAEMEDLFSRILKEFSPLSEAWAEAKEVWASIFTTLLDFENTDWAAIGEGITTRIVGGFADLREIARQRIRDFFEGMTASNETLDWESVPRLIVSLLMTGLRQLNILVGNWIVEFETDVIMWFREIDWAQIGKDAAAFITTGLSDLAQFVLDFLPRWIDNITLWFEGIDWAQIGFNVVVGIITGLESIWGFITETLPNFFTDLVLWFANIDWSGIATTFINDAVDALSGLGNALLAALSDIWSGVVAGFNFATDLGGDNGGGSDTSGMDADPGIRTVNASSPMGGTATNNISNFNMGPVNVNNGMDVATLESVIRRVLVESFA